MRTLRSYQLDAVRFLTERKRALLALPPGAGKTAIVATAVGEMAGPVHVLVVCPNGPVLHHWQDELHAWGNISSLQGTGPKARRAKNRERIAESDYGALILNYESFRNDIEDLAKIPWTAVVFDESHRLKNRTTSTFKAAKKLQSEHLFLVSGTPVLNRATELWTSFHLIDPKKYRSFWRWAESFFKIEFPRYQRRIVREVGAIRSPEHAEILRKQLAEVMYYRPLDEIMPDLPPTIETVYEISLTCDEQEAHDSMLENFWMEVGDEVIQAENAVAKLTRLRQLTSDWSVFGEAPGSKVQAACQLVEELDGEPCVVFVAFRATANAAASIMPNALAYHGGMSAVQRAETLRLFKAGEFTTLVATIKTMGEGVDGLQHVARNVIMLDRDWTPARNEQAIDRVGGARAKQAVNVIHVVAADSTDQVVNDALTEKRSVVSAVMGTRPSSKEEG